MTGRPTLGLVGTGRMGEVIGRRLLATDHPLVVDNRTRARASGLRDAGAEWADSPAEVARRADLVLTVLFDEQAVRDTYLGPAGLLGEPGVCKDLEAVLATAIDAGAAAPVTDALTTFTRIAAAGFVDRDLISVVAHAARQSEPAGPAS